MSVYSNVEVMISDEDCAERSKPQFCILHLIMFKMKTLFTLDENWLFDIILKALDVI